MKKYILYQNCVINNGKHFIWPGHLKNILCIPISRAFILFEIYNFPKSYNNFYFSLSKFGASLISLLNFTTYLLSFNCLANHKKYIISYIVIFIWWWNCLIFFIIFSSGFQLVKKPFREGNDEKRRTVMKIKIETLRSRPCVCFCLLADSDSGNLFNIFMMIIYF